MLLLNNFCNSVTIVIPSFNEEGNLEKLLQLFDESFHQIGRVISVLIIDDGSTDDSPQILSKLSTKYRFLQVIRHPQRQGVTGVWKTAIAHVNTEWLYWSQADLESDPRTDLPLLLQACAPGVDAVAGWRQARGDGKTVASKLANLACRFVFGLKIHDMNWIKVVRRDLLADLPLEITTHRYLLAVLAGQGHHVTEVPTPWHPRYSGKSKFGSMRLVSSAIDFARACWWFYTEKQPILPARLVRDTILAVNAGFNPEQRAGLNTAQREIARL